MRSRRRYGRVGTALHLADYRRAGVDADAQLRTHPVFALKVFSVGIKLLKDRKRRATGPQRCVFKSDGRAKHRQDAVASKALHDATLPTHGSIRQGAQRFEAAVSRGLSAFVGREREYELSVVMSEAMQRLVQGMVEASPLPKIALGIWRITFSRGRWCEAKEQFLLYGSL